MEHLITKLTAAAVMSAVAVATTTAETEKSAESPLPFVPLNLPILVDDSAVGRLIEAGFNDLLLGWEESARVRFAQALQQATGPANQSLLTYCGMMLTSRSLDARDAVLMELREIIDKVPSTPVEHSYLKNFLLLTRGDIAGAAQGFDERAQKYRRDIFSALWAAMLYHCADVGYDALERPHEYQARALQLARDLYQREPQNPLVCYVRAYIEEAAPKVSEEALRAACQAADALPFHPMPQLLYGHLLYRCEQAEKAVPYFKKALELSEHELIPASLNRLKMIAALYESTALWSSRQEEAALATRRAMNAQQLNRDALSDPAEILLRWEANTLPLRVLVLRATPPTLNEINAAVKAATPQPALADDPVLHVRDCLKAALYARARAQQHNLDYAQKSLQLARVALGKLEESQDVVFARGQEFITPWYRAHEACRIAILAAGADVFPESDDFWKKVASAGMRPATMLMPPPIPKQFGPEPAKKMIPKTAPQKSSGAKSKASSLRPRS